MVMFFKVVNNLERLAACDTLSPFDKQEIEQIYEQVMHETFVRTSCNDCYKDAVIMLLLKLKKEGKIMEKCRYRLKNGVLLQPVFGGEMYTNSNLTDEVAKEHLTKFPDDINKFAEYPSDWDKKPQEFIDELIDLMMETIRSGASEQAILEAYADYKVKGKKISAKKLKEHFEEAISRA